MALKKALKFLRWTDRIVDVVKFIPGPHTPLMPLIDLLVDGAESQFGDGHGGEKREWVESVAGEVLDLLHQKGIIKDLFKNDVDTLIEEIVNVKNQAGELTGSKKEDPRTILLAQPRSGDRVAWPVRIQGEMHGTIEYK